MDASLPELEARRAELYARLAGTGDFRRGSIGENYRRCAKANCACAWPGHSGHGPRQLWTRTMPGGKTAGRQLAPGEVDKVRAELEAYARCASSSATGWWRSTRRSARLARSPRPRRQRPSMRTPRRRVKKMTCIR